MTETMPFLPGLSPVGEKTITATFDGGTLSSNGGVLILREIEKRLGLATGSAGTFLTIAMAGVQAQLQRHDAGADVRDCQWP
jgi:hypothetical protein